MTMELHFADERLKGMTRLYLPPSLSLSLSLSSRPFVPLIRSLVRR